MTDVQWEIAQALEKKGEEDKPSWSAIERSPEEGLRRRAAKNMMANAQKVVVGFDFERNGSVYKGGVEVARYDGNTKNWVRKQGWEMLGFGDFTEVVKRAMEG